MSAKQTRRSISVRGNTYAALRQFCDNTHRSMSDVVEEQLSRILSSPPVAPQRETRAARMQNGTAGRPAPTPAYAVPGTRRVAAKRSASARDHRLIQF